MLLILLYCGQFGGLFKESTCNFKFSLVTDYELKLCFLPLVFQCFFPVASKKL